MADHKQRGSKSPRKASGSGGTPKATKGSGKSLSKKRARNQY